MTSTPPTDNFLIQEDGSSSLAPAMTAGQMLRQARQAKGLHLAVLSLTLKVPVKHLEALEADQFDVFKGPTFVRAVAQSMCRHLGMDAAPVLALLPSAVHNLSQPRPSLEPLPRMGGVKFKPQASNKRQPTLVWWGAALMLLVIAAFLWLPMPELAWTGFASTDKSTTVTEDAAVPMGQASNPLVEPVTDASAASPASVVLMAPVPASSSAAQAPQAIVTPAPKTDLRPPNTSLSGGASLIVPPSSIRASSEVKE